MFCSHKKGDIAPHTATHQAEGAINGGLLTCVMVDRLQILDTPANGSVFNPTLAFTATAMIVTNGDESVSRQMFGHGHKFRAGFATEKTV